MFAMDVEKDAFPGTYQRAGSHWRVNEVGMIAAGIG